MSSASCASLLFANCIPPHRSPKKRMSPVISPSITIIFGFFLDF